MASNRGIQAPAWISIGREGSDPPPSALATIATTDNDKTKQIPDIYPLWV